MSSEVAKKPKKGDKIPKKGKMVEGNKMVVHSWGTIRQGPSYILGLHHPYEILLAPFVQVPHNQVASRQRRKPTRISCPSGATGTGRVFFFGMHGTYKFGTHMNLIESE